ncbi:Cro/Cl family transcriptional regulator [Pseudomonas sp. Fl5BN2]|uniref:Cro/Cl family transcriptional regulator n=1 Tax=Pseudomonas sp. Fl5BN2 TaxID=2697652 RepID=UPI001C49BF3B|nr:Cro/Cl family transcriptional regulator [Pseudomonas sp. Fl5BN2]
MKKIPLSKYLEEHGTQAVLAALGVNQSAISQMVRAGVHREYPIIKPATASKMGYAR